MNNKKALLALLAAVLLTGCTPADTSPTPSGSAAGLYTPGSYTAEEKGYGGTVQVTVEVDENSILSVTATGEKETPGVGSKAVESLPVAIQEAQSTEVDDVSGATFSSTAVKTAAKKALNKAMGKDENEGITVGVSSGDTQPTIYEQGWSIQPTYGILKGDYYKEEMVFRQGHTGILEVVTGEDGELLMVEFNETGRPNYYTRLYQNQNKRMSEYNFTMGERKGTAFIQGVLSAEEQMIANQSLTAPIDTVSGASNSVEQAMIPLAEKIDSRLSQGSSQKYYSIAEDIGGGLSGKLEVVVENGRIIYCHYDEIFGDNPEDIEDASLKQYYRTSKYDSIYYEEPSRIGFNVEMDALNEKVVETQDMFDLSGLPAVDASGDYHAMGFTVRSTAWDNYLALAEKLHTEMVRDGVLK
ncbi:MAG: FMN-binding protein [Oscillospiraceae bacterium]|jgi:uncharacterized protein with FMN-binding domain|nr:FMN-binding protein [Oscillospiraceae bacterium]